MPQVLLASDDEVIEAYFAQDLNESLGVSIHVRRQRTYAMDFSTPPLLNTASKLS